MIAEFLFRNPRVLLLSLIMILVAGLTSAYLLPRMEDPVLRQRVGVISTVYPGADPLQVESDITVPLEQQLKSVSQIKRVRSNNRANISNIVVELEDSVKDVDAVWAIIREQIADAKMELPEDCDPDLEVFPLKAFAAIVAIARHENATSDFATWRRLAAEFQAEILNLPGTEKVEVFGDPGEEIIVEVEPMTMVSTQLTAGAIAAQVQTAIQKKTAGSLHPGGTDLLIDLNRDQPPVDRIAETLISIEPGRDPVQLADLSTIQKRPATPATSAASIDGRPAIVLGVMVDPSLQVDRWAARFERLIDRFAAEFSDEVSIESRFSQRDHVHQRMQGLLYNLLISTGAVVLCVFLLMGWRSMIVVGTALPLSVLMVLAAMRWLEIPIHQMSVTGLIVALGLLIDNAIVIVEEVRSRVYEGKTVSAAIRDSIGHLSMPLIGSTLTTVFAFLPIATLPGPAGEFVGTIAISVILAIVSSLILALTVIPAMIGLLGIQSQHRGFFSYGLTLSPLQALYRRSLQLVYRFPLLGIALGILLPVLGFRVANDLPLQFFPPSDRNQVQIEIEHASSSNLTAVQQTVGQVQEILERDPRLIRQNWFMGGSAPTFFYNVVPRRRGTPFYAQAFVNVSPDADLAHLVRELQSTIDNEIFDSRIIVRQLEQGPPFDAPVELRLTGPDLATLQELGSQLRGILAETTHVLHTRSDIEDTLPKLSLDVDPQVARDAGLDESSIARFLYASVAGAPAGNVFDHGVEVPVKVKTRLVPDSELKQLSALTVPGRQAMMSAGRPPAGDPLALPPAAMFTSATLGSLGQFQLRSNVAAIVRIDGQRVNEVKAYIDAGILPSVVLDDFRERLIRSDFALPAGYELEIGGESEKRSEAVNNLIANSVVLFALILFTLVFIFRSFRSAMIIACVGALTVGLGPFALASFGFPFGFMAIVGTMGLIGVAINDSIVVLAAIRANQHRVGDPMELTEVVFGCTRHIIATTLTTIVGFLPLILNGGEFWPPLAICIAGGVSGATLLALYFVPSLFRMLYWKTA